jgi:hypothetical protein
VVGTFWKEKKYPAPDGNRTEYNLVRSSSIITTFCEKLDQYCVVQTENHANKMIYLDDSDDKTMADGHGKKLVYTIAKSHIINTENKLTSSKQ